MSLRKKSQYWKNFVVSKISNSDIHIIAIIPARGGSKSVPRKNLQDLGGFPLISYTIESALRSNLIQEVYVSTEDSEIADISSSYGAKIIQRPDSMATDTSRDDELLINAIENEFTALDHQSLIVFLRPSHPLRNPATIDTAIDTYLSTPGYDSLRSMKLSSEIPYKMWRIGEEGYAIPVTENHSIGVSDPCNAPRQVLPKTYYQDGYVDVFPFSTVLNFSNTAGGKVLPFIIDEFSHDIDTFQDLEIINARLDTAPWPSWFKNPKLLS